MRKLLIPLLAALALPTAVLAEDFYWLYLTGTYFKGTAAGTIPIGSQEECEKVGKEYISGKTIGRDNPIGRYFVCIKGHKPGS